MERSAYSLSGRHGALAGALALAVLLGCERAPSPDQATEWTPADHDRVEEKGRKQGPRTTDQVPQGKGDALVDLVWMNQCAVCHGAEGRGDGPNGPMTGAADLAKLELTEAAVASVLQNGKGRMPKFDQIPPEVVKGLTQKIRGFRAK